jgi:hypothetical protein
MRAEVCGVNGCKRSGFKGRNGLASHRKQCKGQQIGKRTRPRISLLAQWGSHKLRDPPSSRSRGGQDDWEDVDDPLILYEPDNTHDSQPTHTHTHLRLRTPQPFQDLYYTEPPPVRNENENGSSNSNNDLVWNDTQPNSFGMIRSYLVSPSHDPEADLTLGTTCTGPELATSRLPGVAEPGSQSPYQFAPFDNVTIARLLQWQNNGVPKKSNAQLDLLVKNVIDVDGFEAAHLKDFRTQTELKRLHRHTDQLGALASDGWKKTKLYLPMPCPGFKQTEADAPKLEVSGVLWRNLTAVMESAWGSKAARTYHQKPHILNQQCDDDAPKSIRRAWSEVSNSDAVNEEWREICKNLRAKNPKVNLEKYILVMLMIWSDSTHLAQFGTASMWPMYLYFGNQSKYIRGKPSSMAAHHIAYIPSVRGMILYPGCG